MRSFRTLSVLLGALLNYSTVSSNADASVGQALLPGVGTPHDPDFLSGIDGNHSCSHTSVAANCNAIGIIGTELAGQSGKMASFSRNQSKIEEQVAQLASSAANVTRELGKQKVDFSQLEKEVDHLSKVETEHQQDLSYLKKKDEKISANLTLLRDDLTEHEKSAQALKEKVERALVAINDRLKLNEGNLDKVMNSSADDKVSIGELKNQSTETTQLVAELAADEARYAKTQAELLTRVKKFENSSVVSQQERNVLKLQTKELQRVYDSLYTAITIIGSVVIIGAGIGCVVCIPDLRGCSSRNKSSSSSLPASPARSDQRSTDNSTREDLSRLEKGEYSDRDGLLKLGPDHQVYTREQRRAIIEQIRAMFGASKEGGSDADGGVHPHFV